jgi:hypothetical protein
VSPLLAVVAVVVVGTACGLAFLAGAEVQKVVLRGHEGTRAATLRRRRRQREESVMRFRAARQNLPPAPPPPVADPDHDDRR